MKAFSAIIGASLVPAVLAAQNTASFTLDTTGTRAINVITNTINSTRDACFIEMRSTVVNLGVTNATCHIVYIPALPGIFGTRNSLQVDATASHVRNASGQPSGKLNASGALQTCRVVTAGSACWAATLVAEDTSGAVGVLNGLEIDVNLQNPIARYSRMGANPAGVRAVMVGSHQGAVGTAYTAQKLGPGLSGARWSTGFLTADSGASTGLSLGSVGSSPNQGGQPIVLHYRNAGNDDKTAQINVDAAGNLLLRSGNEDNRTATMIQSPLLVANGRVEDASVTLDCGSKTTVAIDAGEGNYFTCNITSNVPVVVQPPNNSPRGQSTSQLIMIAIRNSSGTQLQTPPTFSRSPGGFRFSQVANPGNNMQVLYTFRWDPAQSLWYEVGTHQAAGL